MTRALLAVFPPSGGRLARAGAVALVILVATASLMPHAAVPDSAPNRTDLAIHVVMHGTLGFALIWAWPSYLVAVVAALAFLAIGLECGQIWVPGREFSWADLVTNGLGASLGAALTYLALVLNMAD